MSVVIETTLGDITVDLYLYERPRACLNFLKLCKLKYYNFNLFHTISRGFIAQTGDPTGSRTGGETIYGILEGPSKRYFEGENEPRIKHTKPGLVSFVGDADKMIGSQFFFTLGEDLTYLDEKHCVFGEVVEGFEILEEINEVICDTDDRPYQDVRISHTVVLDDPYPDPKGFIVPSRSPSPSAERLKGGRIAPDEDIDETAGKSAKEIAEMQAEREAKARATILEMVGDIPDAEIAPPENVLFVCKLNPTTNDDDLEIIFSRFGQIKSCEVICDRKSGDSLQYAFIEFAERKSCEEAYFKMDNVLIDDRRIHVDFSQSVSKVRWLGKGRISYFDGKGNKNDLGKGIYKKGDMHEKNKTVEATSPVKRGGNMDRPIKANYKQRSSSPSEKRKENLSRKPERSRERSRSPPQSNGKVPNNRTKSPKSCLPRRSHVYPEQGVYTKTGRSRSRSLEKQRERRQIRTPSRSLEKQRERRRLRSQSRSVEKQRERRQLRSRSWSRKKQRERRQYRSRSPDQESYRTSKRDYLPSDNDKKNKSSERSKRSRSPVNNSVGSSKRRYYRSPPRSSSTKGGPSRHEGETRSTNRKLMERNLSNLSPKRTKRSRTPAGNCNKTKQSKVEKSSDDSDTDHKAHSKILKKDKQKKESKAKKKKVDSSDDSDSSDSESEEVLEKKSKHKKKRKRKITYDTDSSDSSSSSSSNSDSSSSYKNRSKGRKTASKKRKKRK